MYKSLKQLQFYEFQRNAEMSVSKWLLNFDSFTLLAVNKHNTEHIVVGKDDVYPRFNCSI